MGTEGKKLTIVKFVNDETFYFPEDIYDVQVFEEKKLRVEHKPSHSTSMEADMKNVLYLRRHIYVKGRDIQEVDTDND